MATLLRVNHVNIAAPKSKEKEIAEFYEGVLGLKKAYRPAEIAAPGVWYDFGTGNQLHISYADDFRSELVGDHFAVEVDDMEALMQQLKAHGVELRGPSHMNFDNSERLFCRDPFGNQLEFMYYHK